MKVKGTMLLSPVISFKCLSKGQIVLVIKKEVFIKTVMQLPRGWSCRQWLLDVWRILEGSMGPSVSWFTYAFIHWLFFHTHPFNHSSICLFYSFSSHLLGLYGLCAGQGNRFHLWEVLPCIFSDSSYWLKKPADFQSVRTLWEWRLLPASNWNQDRDCESKGKVWAHVIHRFALLSHPREAIH